jgi:hypothetical protein
MLVSLSVDAKAMRFGARDVFSVDPPDIAFVRANIGDQRTMTINLLGLAGDRGAAYGIPEITSLNMAHDPEYVKYFNSILQLDASQRWGVFPTLGAVTDAPSIDHFDWNGINFLGVRYVLLPHQFVNFKAMIEQHGLEMAFESDLIDVYFNPAAKPHAFSVNWPDNLAEKVIPTSLPDGYKRVTITKYRNTLVEMTGEVAVPSLVVLTDTWHKNWAAEVNGKVASIERVNGVFRGINVPAGQFTIKMSYRPASLTAGIVVSLFTIVAIIAFLARSLLLPSQRRLAS